MFRKFAFIGIFTVLAGCETFSGMGRDIDHLIEVTGIDSDILSLPVGTATKAPEILPSTMNLRTGIVIQSEQDKADAAAKQAAEDAQKASSDPLSGKKPEVKKAVAKKPTPKKTISSKKKSTASQKTKTASKKDVIEKKSSPVNVKKNPLCISDPIDKLENISQLYRFYYKKPKACKGQDYSDKAINIYRLILTGKDHQDARLMNADHGFLQFTIDILRYAPQEVRKKGATFLTSTGCGFISSVKCKYIINLK